MGWLYQNAVKPALFRLDPERAHELGVDALALLGAGAAAVPAAGAVEPAAAGRTGRSSASG